MIALRPYQSTLIDTTRQHMRAGARRVLIQLPTGGGKTALASRMLHGAADRGKRVWFAVHRRELVRQVCEAFEREGIRHGVVAADHPMQRDAMSQVCSIPTLIRRAHKLPPPDLICIDECHHACATTWRDLFARFPKAYHIGLSATPSRMDGRGLADHFDAMVCGPTVAELIADGHLAKYKLFAPATVDTTGLRQRMGDFVTSELMERVSRPQITGDAISHYRKHCDGKRAIVFAVSVEHSKAMATAFNVAGVPAAHVDGTTDPTLRDDAMRDFQAGRLRVLSNVELFGEGVDCPALEAVILLRPTMSLAMYLQQVGRALRPSPGKDTAVILDHVGNSVLHGLPDDDREWTLTQTATKDRKKCEVPAPRICPACFAASRSGSRTCTNCGAPFPVEAREVVQVEGELAEVAETRKVRRQVNPVTTLEALRELGVQRGYKPGWADHVWAARQAKGAT